AAGVCGAILPRNLPPALHEEQGARALRLRGSGGLPGLLAALRGLLRTHWPDRRPSRPRPRGMGAALEPLPPAGGRDRQEDIYHRIVFAPCLSRETGAAPVRRKGG